jgi:hypothetical protein
VFLFYKDTIGLPVKFVNEKMDWAEFDLGGVSLAVERVERNDAEAQSLVGRFVGISIQFENIHETYQDLSSKNVQFEGLPAKQPWGGSTGSF